MVKRLQHFTVRCFAGLGYVSVLLQWFFVVLVYVSVMQHHGLFDRLMTTDSSVDVPVPVVVDPVFGLFEFIVMVVVVAVVVTATVYVLRQLPGSILRRGHELTHAPAEALAPFIFEHRHSAPTKRQQLRLTARLVLGMKAILIVLPVALLVPVIFIDGRPLELLVMWSVMMVVAVISIVCFAAEWILARIFKVELEKTG